MNFENPKFEQIVPATRIEMEPLFALELVAAKQLEAAINRLFIRDLKVDGYAGCTIKQDEKGNVSVLIGFKNNSKYIQKANIPTAFLNAGIDNEVRILDDLKKILYGNFVESVLPQDMEVLTTKSVTVINASLTLAIRTAYQVGENDMVIINSVVPVGGKKNRELMITFGCVDGERFASIANALGMNNQNKGNFQKDQLEASLNTNF